MKKKVLQCLISFSILCTAAGAFSPVYAEDAVEVIAAEDSSVAEATDAADENTDTVDMVTNDFVEGSALLSEFGYEAGEVSSNGWMSKYLGMSYVPDSSISMGLSQNKQLKEYYERNGKDKMVANNEFVAMGEKGSYLQLVAEVNPNHETAEDILDRFAEIEKLDLLSEKSEMEVAGKTFLTCTGVADKEKYMIGVSVDDGDIALAMKIKYDNSSTKKTLLGCFEDVAVDEEDVDATPIEDAYSASALDELNDAIEDETSEFEVEDTMDGEEE